MDRPNQDRHAQYYEQPFTPTQNLSAQLRIANALEYAAAQLGTIAKAVSQIEARLDRQETAQIQKNLVQENAGLSNPLPPKA